MLRLVLSAAAACFLSISTAAADGPIWAVDPENSALDLVIDIGGMSTPGAFADWNAIIAFNPDHPEEATLQVDIHMASITIDDTRANAVGEAAWLDIAAHPVSVFMAQGFDWSPEGPLTIHGDLTLKGITAPMSLTGTLFVDGIRGVADVSGTIPRLIHEVGLGQDAVGAEVQIQAHIVATRNAP